MVSFLFKRIEYCPFVARCIEICLDRLLSFLEVLADVLAVPRLFFCDISYWLAILQVTRDKDIFELFGIADKDKFV